MVNQKDTIPRLQHIGYLFETLSEVVKGATFDSVRRRLIDHTRKLLQVEEMGPRTGHTAHHRLRYTTPTSYWSNARDALEELMRLGLVEKNRLPRKPHLVVAYANEPYFPTSLGARFARDYEAGDSAFLDKFFTRVYFTHPYVRHFIAVLRNRLIFVPILTVGDVNPDLDRKARVELAARETVESLRREGINEIEKAEVEARFWSYVSQKIGKHRGNVTNSRFYDFLNSAAQDTALEKYGLPVDHLTFDQLRYITEQFYVANYSYHVPGYKGLVVWLTSEVDEQDGERLSIQRRGVKEFTQAVLDHIPKAFRLIRETQRSAFVPIHEVRAAVCFELRLNNEVFDTVLRDLFLGHHRVPYQINLDPGMHGAFPPSAGRPFRVKGRNYYIMTMFLERGGYHGNPEATMDA